MIFSFLKYIRPTWYFNLRPSKDFNYFPSKESIETAGFQLEYDASFSSLESQKRDLAWRAFQMGFISDTETPGLDVWQTIKLPVEDEYRFFRKNFHKAWCLYVLLFRLVTLKNPIKEVAGFFKTRGVRKENYANISFEYSEYASFESSLIAQNPKVSVIIPTLNRYVYLKDVFKDLEQQTYKNFEVIVVDQTDAFDESAYQGWNFELRYWFQPEKALWKARNEAIKAAKGNLILLYDDDSLVDPDWIEQHLKTLDYFKADLSSGVSISTVGAAVPKHYSYFRWSEQLDTGNVLLRKEIFQEIGLFDRQFEKQRMGDGEFGLRAYLAGYKNISNCKAKRIHLKVGEGGLRQMGSWDGWRPKKILDPRPVPSVLYLTRKYFGTKLSVFNILVNLIPSLVPYRFKRSKILKLTSFLLFPLLFPLLGYQVLKSWTLATKKLNEGNKIEYYK